MTARDLDLLSAVQNEGIQTSTGTAVGNFSCDESSISPSNVTLQSGRPVAPSGPMPAAGLRILLL
jgi:hypothetical protein